MKTLVIGGTGMLGSDLVKALNSSLRNKYEVTAWASKDCDITRAEEMQKITDLAPELIFNCAAYTDVDKAEVEKELCNKINVTGVKNLVDACKTLDSTLVHISSDYVFNGFQFGYSEQNKKSPINVYGQSKADAEDIIANTISKFFIVRTSCLFGKNGKNFVDTIKRLGSEKEELKVVNDQFTSPTYTKDLAAALLNLSSNHFKNGIYHITNYNYCSWFEFAKEIKTQANLTCNILLCSSKDFPRPAKRPTYGILNNNNYAELRFWKEALTDYLSDLSNLSNGGNK